MDFRLPVPTEGSTLATFDGELARARGAGGEPLPDMVRTFMEPRFGRAFHAVRLHRGEKANALTSAVNARAFTIGHDLFFRTGEFEPATEGGRRVIAHELAHVVQQGADGSAAGRHGARHPSAGRAESIQRIVPGRPTPDDETASNARRQIEAARQQLDNPNLEPADREALEARISSAEAALRRYRRTLSSGGMSGALATSTTGNPAGVVVALFALVATLFVAQAVSQSPAQRRAADELGRSLGDLATELETLVLMTAAGNVIHGHIVDEARQLAIELGLAATAAAVTTEILCEMLNRMAAQTRRTDTEKWKKIISTLKGLGCRRSRAGR